VRPFRFGVVVRGGHSRDDWRGKARRAEELGYDAFVVPDHFRDQVAPAVAIMAAADATTTIRVGSLVFDNDFRHPAVLAKDAATLDLLTGGRFELGIGAGWMRADYEQTGLPFDPGRVRVDRLEEALHIITGFFAGESVTFKGQHYAVTELPGLPRPVQRPRPPLLVGGGGPRILALAAREADIVGITPRSLAGGGLDLADTRADAMEAKIAAIRAAAGPRLAELELNILVQRVAVGENVDAAAAEFAVQWKTTPEALWDSPFVLMGAPGAVEDMLEARRARYGISYIVVFEQFMEAFAPVVRSLAGR
jgi:probable F420-dependent oxidoreductase